MDMVDESALEREGAQAATRGASWHSNPFLLRPNMPQATGESLADWSARHDAWQRGFEGHFQLGPDVARRRKDPMTAALLMTLVQRRLHWLPSARAHTAAHPQTVLRLPVPTAHERDHAGRNWDMEHLEGGSRHDVQLEVEFRSVVERLRDQYDIAPSADAISGELHMVALQAVGPEPDAAASGTGMPTTAGAGLTERRAPASPCSRLDSQVAPDATGQVTPSARMESPQRSMRELGIRRIGWRYEYCGYCYDRVADAMAYARLPRNVDDVHGAVAAPLAPDELPRTPCANDLALMAARGITFDAGVYRLESYRYDRLADAVAYAVLLAQRSARASDSTNRSGR